MVVLKKYNLFFKKKKEAYIDTSINSAFNFIRELNLNFFKKRNLILF